MRVCLEFVWNPTSLAAYFKDKNYSKLKSISGNFVNHFAA